MTTITVTESANNTFEVDVDSIDLTTRGNDRIPLQWDVVSTNSSWRFPGDGDGIEFKNDGDVFEDVVGSGPRRRTSARKAGKAHTGPNTAPRACEYKITVTNGTTTLIIDPTIINQP